ncbi:MAG: CopG family transcriptional regulator [Actinomycetota bacterium]
MNRTQVYLTNDETALLDGEAERTGASRSELIRRAINAQYGRSNKALRREALLASAGSWRDRSFTGKEYVDTIRGDLNKRLSRLGLR